MIYSIETSYSLSVPQMEVLVALMRSELDPRDDRLEFSYNARRLVLTFQGERVLCWRVARRRYIGTSWKHRTFRAYGPIRARNITARLVFAFCRERLERCQPT